MGKSGRRRKSGLRKPSKVKPTDPLPPGTKTKEASCGSCASSFLAYSLLDVLLT